MSEAELKPPLKMPERVKHGTNTAYTYYRCRCQECKDAHAAAARRYHHETGRFSPWVDAEPVRTWLGCLLSFGVRPGKISEAMDKRHRGKPRIRRPQCQQATRDALYWLHWGLYRSEAGGPFRRHCGCEVPDEVRESREAA